MDGVGPEKRSGRETGRLSLRWRDRLATDETAFCRTEKGLSLAFRAFARELKFLLCGDGRGLTRGNCGSFTIRRRRPSDLLGRSECTACLRRVRRHPVAGTIPYKKIREKDPVPKIEKIAGLPSGSCSAFHRYSFRCLIYSYLNAAVTGSNLRRSPRD